MEGKVAETLFVFDFDHTLIDDNSDTWIMDLCPELNLRSQLHSLRTQYSSWTKLMDHVFSLIHEQGRTKDEIINHMKKVRLFEQALKAVSAVHESKDSNCIILSDSNTIFIDTMLEECSVKDKISYVISNPAYFDGNGRLHVQHYHSHDCKNCLRSPNLCKGKALKEYLSEHCGYKRIVYVGDGRNDLCPCLKLTSEDVVICREGYGLQTELQKESSSCCAKIHTLDFVSVLGDFIISKIL